MSTIISSMQAAIDEMRLANNTKMDGVIPGRVIQGLVDALETIKAPTALVLPAGGLDPNVVAHAMRVMGEGRPMLLAVDAGCSASLFAAPTGIEEVDRDWSEMWSEIITPGGMVDVVQMKKEFSDFSTLIHNTTQVLEHVTGGQCTKPMTLPSVVIALADDAVTKQIEEAVAEAIEKSGQQALAPMGADDLARFTQTLDDFTEGLDASVGMPDMLIEWQRRGLLEAVLFVPTDAGKQLADAVREVRQ